MNAITKRSKDGVVVIDAKTCVGCTYCTWACPYGAIQMSEDGRADKCDLCVDRLDQNLAPACVKVCPTEALEVDWIDSIDRRHPDATDAVPGLPREKIDVKPNIRVRRSAPSTAAWGALGRYALNLATRVLRGRVA